jgi:hypothetical protein
MNKDIALKYARNGFSVIPLHTPGGSGGSGCSCGESGCKVGKHPRIAEWQRTSCDEATVAGYWQQWPDANIGLRLDDLIVLDVDGPEGADSLAALEQQHGMLIAGAQQRTGSGGGWHYVFQAVEGVGKRIRFMPGLDLLTGAGAYVVVEPSLHASGGSYHWVDALNPATAHRSEIALTAPPAWLLEAASTQKPKATARPTRPAGERVPAERILALALQKVQSGMGRNDAGLWLFTQMRDNGYSRDEAQLILRDWVAKANEASPGQDRYTMREGDATLRSAYKRDRRDPWDEGEKPSQADMLLKLIDDFEFFKSGPANDAYVRMVIGDHREVWKVDAKGPKVREVLTHRFLTQKDRAPSREALNVALDTILARCSMGPKVDVHVRFSRSRDAIYLDLCDDQWRAVQITADGWQVVKEPPVLFRRGAGARPLPVPVKGGTLDSLRALLNAGDDSQWCLMMSWLAGAFLPEGAFSHLVLNGEQGSAKSTTALVLLSMLDPSDAGLSAPPKDETDATVSAMHAGILAYDNLSGCRAELADVFCRFSTGQGYRTRTFYENLGITVANVKLPIMLNGIDATVMRGDLLERSITLKLPLVTSKTRLTEQEIWADFAVLHPTCLGALLTAVSAGLRNLPNTTLTDAPRMSDFCRWITACESALPWKPGQFLTAYRGKMQDANIDLAEDDSVATAMLDWADSNLRGATPVELVAKTLLVQLNDVMQDCPKDLRHWPASPGALAHKLVRLAPVLRAQGVEVRKLRRTSKARSRWEIRRTGPQLPLFIEQDGLKNVA